jgi:hypothetical protein
MGEGHVKHAPIELRERRDHPLDNRLKVAVIAPAQRRGRREPTKLQDVKQLRADRSPRPQRPDPSPVMGRLPCFYGERPADVEMIADHSGPDLVGVDIG